MGSTREKKIYYVNMKRAPKPPGPALELTWALYSDPEMLWRESFQATACLFSLQSFPSVTADSRRLGEILTAVQGRAARRGGEGKAPAGSDATGLGSG